MFGVGSGAVGSTARERICTVAEGTRTRDGGCESAMWPEGD
jgi:hypothetical protein